MRRQNATLHNQILLPFSAGERLINAAMFGTNAGPSPKRPILPTVDRLDNGNGRVLADAKRSRLSRLLDAHGEAWFLSLDADDDTPTDPDAADPNSTT